MNNNILNSEADIEKNCATENFKEQNSEILDKQVDYKLDSLKSWVVVIASFFNLIIASGVAYSSGIFIKHYSDVLFKDKVPLSTLTFIGTLCIALTSLLSIVTGRLADRIGYRKSILIGSVIYFIGLLLASFSYEIWHIFLTQGVIIGIGGGITFVPAVSAPTQWFNKYIGLATGIAVAGSGVGGLIFSPITQYALDELGYQWALRIQAIISLVVLMITPFFIKERVKAGTKGVFFEFNKFENRKFLVLFFGGFLYSFGYLVPFLLMPKYAQCINLSEAQGAILIGLLNGGSAIGRVVLGSMGDRFGGFVSMLPVVTVQLFGVEGVASINGLLYFGSGIPNLIGTPIASAILFVSSSSPQNPNYLPVIMYTGTSAALGACFFLLLN